MEKLVRDSGIFEVSVNKYDDLLILNCADLSVFQKFTTLYDNVESISKEAGMEIEELNKKYASNDAESVSTDAVLSYVNTNITFSKKVMEELDSVFGEDFTRNVFRENYEANPNFVPDEIALTELIDSLIPVMEKAYGERVKRNKSKYNANKRGKHTRTKSDLISEYTGKGGTCE